MNVLNFHVMPRYVGNPKQELVHSVRELLDFVHRNNGLNSCFTSVYALNPELTHVLVDKIFLDLDNEKKPENAQFDAQSLSSYTFEQFEIPSYVNFSGSKGYHAYTPFGAEWYTIEEAARLIRAVQTEFVNAARLRTADPKIIGDSRRITRIPYTKHCSRLGIVSGRYCCPLSHEMLYNWNHADIQQYSYAPQKVGWYYVEGLPTIDQFIEMFDVPMKQELIETYAGKEVQYRNFDNRFVVELFPDMCIHNDLLSRNPRTITRFYAVVYCKRVLGWSIGSIINFFSQLNMIDYDAYKTTYHVDYIYRRKAYNNLPNCHSRRREGICVGASCPKYQQLRADSKTSDLEGGVRGA